MEAQTANFHFVFMQIKKEKCVIGAYEILLDGTILAYLPVPAQVGFTLQRIEEKFKTGSECMAHLEELAKKSVSQRG